MKEKKGFTLIELLAVIVILAIIMVIAVPKILDVIENSRRSAAKSSIELVKDAIKTQVNTGSLSGTTFEKTGDCYEFNFADQESGNAKKLALKNKEKIGGSIKYCNGKLQDDELEWDGNSTNDMDEENNTYIYKDGVFYMGGSLERTYSYPASVSENFSLDYLHIVKKFTSNSDAIYSSVENVNINKKYVIFKSNVPLKYIKSESDNFSMWLWCSNYTGDQQYVDNERNNYNMTDGEYYYQIRKKESDCETNGKLHFYMWWGQGAKDDIKIHEIYLSDNIPNGLTEY